MTQLVLSWIFIYNHKTSVCTCSDLCICVLCAANPEPCVLKNAIKHRDFTFFVFSHLRVTWLHPFLWLFFPLSWNTVIYTFSIHCLCLYIFRSIDLSITYNYFVYIRWCSSNGHNLRRTFVSKNLSAYSSVCIFYLHTTG